MADVRQMTTVLKERSRHELRREDDYINAPKPDGYRSHHLIYSFCSNRRVSEQYDGRRVEIQIRSRLQHSWATAVEAVGMVKGQYLKGSKGDPKWLRLFHLMSGELAMAEHCPESEHLPPHRERVAEIVELNRELMAVNTLDNLSNIVRWTQDAIATTDRPTMFLIQYDNTTNQVEVTPYFNPKTAARAYDLAEVLDNERNSEIRNVVLVEADKLQTLKDAYPNYFGDVQLFKAQLKHVVGGRAAREYKIKPQEKAPPPALEHLTPDTAWFRRSPFKKPKGA
jgi:hypothetical protein